MALTSNRVLLIKSIINLSIGSYSTSFPQVFITSSDDSDREDCGEENSHNENSDEKNFDEEN